MPPTHTTVPGARPSPADGCLASLPQLIEQYVPDLGE